VPVGRSVLSPPRHVSSAPDFPVEEKGSPHSGLVPSAAIDASFCEAFPLATIFFWLFPLHLFLRRGFGVLLSFVNGFEDEVLVPVFSVVSFDPEIGSAPILA